MRDKGGLELFPEKFVVQLNDTHPAIAIAEFMRLLVDEHRMDWDSAWRLAQKTFAYTNHTLLPEALETWPLADLLHRAIDGHWLQDLTELAKLEPFAEDAGFRREWREVKRSAKVRLAEYILATTNVTVDPDSLFDVQAKRIHEYKRQHLSLLHVISLYLKIKHNPHLEITPRTFIFAGKAAPGYRMAKLIIKLVNSVAEIVNRDPATNRLLKVVFVPNMNVKMAQHLYPAADLSEQISTAGKEASGIGNMKFSMNGALTIGTLDGANVEIREAVGGRQLLPVRPYRGGRTAVMGKRLPPPRPY